jgi:hypothetical protein
MRKNLALLSAAAALAVAPAHAIDVPQSRAEFVKAIEDGRGADVETIRIAQPLAKIYPLLEERAKTCLDVTVNRVGNVGYVERSSTDYNPTVRRIGDDRAEFTLQLAHNPRAVGSTPPPGGLYFIAADLRATGEGHTEVLLYRPSLGTQKITESLKAWLGGDPAPCPKLR